jgi:tetratricopeptide (TPR) repeat protein
MADSYDAFLSYGHGDAEWVHILAGNLERLGVHVFLDAWELVGGDLIAARLQDGLAKAGSVVFVVSPNSVRRGWVGEEFAAAVAVAAMGRGRLIPVLLGEVELPPFVASRLYVDFRNLDHPDAYAAKLKELVSAIRGQPGAARPAAGEGIVVPPGAYRAEGPRSARLKIAPDEVSLSTAERVAVHCPAGLDARTRSLLAELEVARARLGAPLRADVAAAAHRGLSVLLAAVGVALGSRFLDGEAGVALAAEVAAAEAGNSALRLALEVEDALIADLPWEALVLPGKVTPLALEPRVEVYRTVALAHPPSAIQVRGPLRILAVIASPESGGRELLDYEAELAAIIDAVNPARRHEGAYVHVLNWGSLAAIRAALLAQRFHVLHLSCHARPGELTLEDAVGREDMVGAARFAAEALVADRGVPLVVLAGCSTALAAVGPEGMDGGAETEAMVGEAAASARALEGLARELLRRGVPALIAMTAPVTDRYAAAFAAEVYRELAAREDPVPLAAVADARRVLETRRRALPPNDPWAAVVEWATPVLVQAGPALSLFHRADGLEEVARPVAPVFDPMMVVRRVGEFVGRRAELRQLLGVLRASGPGVVVHGIGGVGKSTLAAQLIEQLGADSGLVVAVSGATDLTADLILETLRTRLVAHVAAKSLGEQDPLRQAAVVLTGSDLSWQQRFDLVRQLVFPRLPVLLLIDNAEDLLTTPDDGEGELADAELADFLAAWVRAAPQARLVGTTRYRFRLPGGLQRRLRWHHLGPLSLAETRKLIWRLPALDMLALAQQERAYTIVGGHPRTLEYLDALLRGGDAAFPDVAERLEATLKRRGITRPENWLQGVKGDLDQALAEAVTLAADDVLLDGLLALLAHMPAARALLDGLAVYRRPVDDTGVAWQLSQLTTSPDPPADLLARVEPIGALLMLAQQAGTAQSVEDLGLDDSDLAQYRRDMADLARPPVTLTGEARHALALLADLGLAAPAPPPASQDASPDQPGFVVHRWTAAALERRIDTETLKAAHRRAAAYWRWRVAVFPQSRAEDVEQLLEARYHHHAAGDLDSAVDATRAACGQLRTWGAWTTERQLWDEALGWVLPRSHGDSSIRFQLGVLAQLRGDYLVAEQRYHEALAISEELDDQTGIAAVYGQLGNLAYLHGDYSAAEQRYYEALAIYQKLGDRAGAATSYHQLGGLAERRGDYHTAEQHYQQSRVIFDELGDRASLAVSYHQLGNLAHRRGHYDTAEQHYQQSLRIFDELGDRARIAASYHQLGMLAYSRGDFDTAEQHYHASLAIEEELGARVGASASYHELAVIAHGRGDYDTAERYYRASLVIDEELGDRAGVAASYHQLGMLAQDRGDFDTAEQHYHTSLAIKGELGEMAEMARTLSQLGELHTNHNRPASAVGYQLQSLAIRTELGAPGTGDDVHLLQRQRAALGDRQFHDVLRQFLSDDDTAAVMQLTTVATSIRPNSTTRRRWRSRRTP